MHPVIEKFVLHWGEMGTRWGVNRSVAQIHAFLYLAENPVTAEELADTLNMARSNVSNSLKELLSWELIHVTHILGDRRDHYIANDDTWAMMMTIIEGRKRREIDPTLTMLRQCVSEAEQDRSLDKVTKAKIKNTLSFIEMLVDWFEDIKGLPEKTLARLVKLGSKVTKVFTRK